MRMVFSCPANYVTGRPKGAFILQRLAVMDDLDLAVFMTILLFSSSCAATLSTTNQAKA